MNMSEKLVYYFDSKKDERIIALWPERRPAKRHEKIEYLMPVPFYVAYIQPNEGEPPAILGFTPLWEWNNSHLKIFCFSCGGSRWSDPNSAVMIAPDEDSARKIIRSVMSCRFRGFRLKEEFFIKTKEHPLELDLREELQQEIILDTESIFNNSLCA